MTRVGTLVGIFVIVGLVAGLWIGGVGPFSSTEATPQPGSVGGGTLPTGVVCADTLSTGVTVTQYNPNNDTGTESYDQTARLYKVQADGTEQLFATLTDLTNPSATNVNCGDTYRLRLQSGDDSNARITAVRSGEGATLSSDGRFVEFQAQGAVYNLEVDSPQRAGLRVKVFDLKQNGWVFADDGNAASAYRTSGVTFQSTTDNATATTVGTAEDISFRIDVRANGVDVDANDLGMYMLVDADTAVWAEPSVRFAGRELVDVKGNLDTFESRAFSNYEYVYRIDDSIVDRDRSMDFQVNALSGINPGASDDITLAFAGIGASKQTSGNLMRYAATTDAASPATVFTLQTFGINLG
jgi:hypothetical protein